MSNYIPANVVQITLTDNDILVVTLKTNESPERFLNISVGASEGLHIAQMVDGIKSPRPMSNDLLASIANKLGGTFVSSQISNLIASVFHGQVFYKNANGNVLAFDARSSDAIILAMIHDQPIFISTFVLDTMGISCNTTKNDHL